jgi:pimeloyl-[acyl-carrier protein] methyl ester esterase
MTERPPQLVLMPGMDGSGELFRGLSAQLSSAMQAQVMRYPAEQWLSYQGLAEVVRHQLQAERPMVLVAESYSSPVAILLAAAAPENLRGIVLCSGFATSPLRGWRRTLLLRFASELVALPLPGSLVRWLLLGDEAPQSLVDAFREAVDWVLPQVLAARVRQVLMTNVLAELAQVRVPILYLQGTEDRLLNQECLLEARAVMPGRTVAIRAPHMLLQCEPKACADLIVEFARGLV